MIALKNTRRTVTLGLLALTLTVGATAALAGDLVQPDQRINQVVYFGGEALYCVNGDYEPTTNYGEIADGGIRLLSESGQELLYVPYSTIADAVAESRATGEGVLVASGEATYGTATLYAYAADDSTVNFSFSAPNQWGSTETLNFTNCFPEGPVPYETDDAEAT